MEDLRKFTDRMADITVELIEGTTSPLAGELYLTPPMAVPGKGSILMFSGGIGHSYYNPVSVNTLDDITIHDDIGPLLADSLRRNPTLSGYQVLAPTETMRSRCLGDGTKTITFSGSTIWAEREILPLKNIPVIQQQITPRSSNQRGIALELKEAVSRSDLDPAVDRYALVLNLSGALDYQSLLQLASGLPGILQVASARNPTV